MSGSLLEVRDLSVAYTVGGTTTHAVRGVSFDLGRERLGLVPRPGVVTATRLAFDGQDLRGLSPRQWSRIRGRRMAMILQDPRFALNPVMTVETQVTEAYRLHHGGSAAAARRRALAMLDAVSIRDPEAVLRLYPHQLSGGMGQRVMIAAMLIAEPDLLIADEAISALDVTVGNEVLGVLDRLVTRRGMGLILISHNLTAIASFCDRVLVMYGGRVVEDCAAAALGEAHHPYTRALLAAAPDLDRPRAVLSTVARDPAWLA